MNFAAQGLADVALPLGGVKPLSENFMNSLPSGARKTYTDSVVSRGVERRQLELWDAYHEEMKEWRNKEAAYKRKREHILSNKKLSQEQIDEELGKLVEPPPEPLSPRICMGGDPTPEGHYKQLQRGHASQYFDEDEGGMTLGSHAWTREVQQKTMSFYNKLWDGKALDRTRSADGDNVIRARRLSSLIAVQPTVARDLLDNQLAKEVGFLSRWLIVEPEPLHGTRFEDPDEERTPSQALQAFNDRVYELLKIPLQLREGTQNELAPRVIGFDEKARRLWFDFYNEVEAQLTPGGEYEEIYEFASKAAEHAGRLAATLAIFENPEARFISAQDAAEGIALARFYMHEHLRLAVGEKPDIQTQKAQKLIDWLRDTFREKYGELVSISDVSKIGPKSCRGKASDLVEFLVLHGHLQEENGPVEIRGKRRRKVFRILDDEDQEEKNRGDRGDRGDTVGRQGKEQGDTGGDTRGDSKSVAPSLPALCFPGSSPSKNRGDRGDRGDTVGRQGKEQGDTGGDTRGDSKSVAPSLPALCFPGSSPSKNRGDRGDRGDTVGRQGKEQGDTGGDTRGDSKSVAPKVAPAPSPSTGTSPHPETPPPTTAPPLADEEAEAEAGALPVAGADTSRGASSGNPRS